MLNIKDLLVMCIISLVIGVLSSGFLVYKYQENKYEKIISDISAKTAQTIKTQTEKVLENERKNTDIISSLERNALTKDKRIQSLLADNRSLVFRNGGLRVSGSCEATNRASSSTSSNASTETSVCILSRETTETIVEEAHRGDTLGEYADVCHEYAKAIEEQRQRMMKEQNDNTK